MDNCKKDKEILILAANKDLPLLKRIEVLYHVRRCKECKKIFLEYKMLSGMIRGLPEYEAPDSVMKAVENKTKVKTSEPSVLEDLLSVLLYSRIKFAGAAAVIIVMLSIAVFRLNSHEMNKSAADNYYSSTEISSANVKTKEALALLGKFLNKTQVELKSEILGQKLADPLNKGINTATQIFINGDKNEKN